MKTKTLIVASFLALTSGVAQAGSTVKENVVIDLENMRAYGSMSASRFSKNEFEVLGCGTRNYLNADGSTYQWGFCQAANSEDEESRAFCFTENSDLMTEIKSLSAYSFITFSWDAEGECRSVGHSTQSQYIPSSKSK